MLAQKILRANRMASAKLVFFAALMFGFGWAMVPLYYLICDVTGIKLLARPDDGEAARGVADGGHIVRFEFDTNARGLVSMTPSQQLVEQARPGESYSVIYELKNLSGRPLVAQAVPSYAPARAANYVAKIQCFCFNQLTLRAGETRQEPVVLILDKRTPEDLRTIALSYTVFEVEGAQLPPSGPDS